MGHRQQQQGVEALVVVSFLRWRVFKLLLPPPTVREAGACAHPQAGPSGRQELVPITGRAVGEAGARAHRRPAEAGLLQGFLIGPQAWRAFG